MTEADSIFRFNCCQDVTQEIFSSFDFILILSLLWLVIREHFLSIILAFLFNFFYGFAQQPLLSQDLKEYSRVI